MSEKMNSKDLKEVTGGQANEKGLKGSLFDEPHWTITNRCGKCGKQYEETCWSHQKVVTPGVCPDCKGKERLERQQINPQ